MRYIKQVFLMLTVAFAVLFSGCAAPRQAQGNVVHRSTYADFEMPAAWRLVDEMAMDTWMVFVPADIDISEQPSNVVVEIQPSWEPREFYEVVGQDFVEFVRVGVAAREGGNAQLVSNTHFETHFGEVIVFEITDELHGNPVHQTQFYMLVDNFMAVVTATYYEDNVEGLVDIARNIVDTISFNDPGERPEASEPFVLPPSPYKGEWEGQVYFNEFLQFRFEMPEGWEIFPREFLAQMFGLEAEESIEIMATSANNELLQVFIAEYDTEQGLVGFLTAHTEGIDSEATPVQASEVGEVVLAGETYTFAINTITDDVDGNVLIQHNFARLINEDTIFVISFMYAEGVDRDVIAFLEAALAQ